MITIPNHHLKAQAMAAYYPALHSGVITRPPACERCGDTGYIHGHHIDYAKPLVVEWLCASCHAKTHQWFSKPESRAYEMMKAGLWTPTEISYPCACGCGANVTYKGYSRPPKWHRPGCRQRHYRARVKKAQEAVNARWQALTDSTWKRLMVYSMIGAGVS